jgi:ubiquitin-like-conjugating enzyme ATG3
MEEYRDATLTNESFKFIEGAVMPTVHPCKHANVLKEMSDTIEEGGNKFKVQPEMALFIFLKFIATVIPTVQFDLTGDLWLS